MDDRQIRDYFIGQAELHKEFYGLIKGEKQCGGYPTGFMNIMEHSAIEYIAGMPGYKNNPASVYGEMQRKIGVEFIDQWIPDNPLSLGDSGYENPAHSATTGADRIVVDGMEIAEPEDVCEHMERFVFPALDKAIKSFDFDERVLQIGQTEYNISRQMGDDMLKTGYGFIAFPCMRYFTYGYENYFCAYALYPEVMERDFKLQAELALLNNTAAAEAYGRYALPGLHRLDHDMTDSRGTLVDIKSMAKIWFPYLAKSLGPVLDAGVRLIWHCDGNIMPMVPYLLEIGISGFQGFQYEDGVDFAAICRMKPRDGGRLFVWAGSSVTRTLPFGTPDDVRGELKYLVENRGDASLALGATSSVTPGVSLANLDAMIEGLRYYRTHMS